MRLLYAVHAYKPAFRIGGPVISVSAAAERLSRKGHAVIVFTTNTDLDEELDVPVNQPTSVDGVEVWYFRREEPIQKWLPFIPYLSQSLGFFYCPAMRDALDRVLPSVDAVDTQMPFVYPTYAAAHAAFRQERPLFYHQRGTLDPARLRFRGLKKRAYISAIEKPIMRRATTLIALTEAERAAYRALGVETHCEVIPNGIDIPLPRDGAAARTAQRFRIPDDVPVVLFLGRLHPTKGADVLLQAFSDAAPKLGDTVLVMAGPDEWGLIPQWQEKIKASNLQSRIVFTGMLTGEAKDDMLARADLFSLPSIGEGFSMAVLEALANRTPVMLSPGCNFPEVTEAGAGRVVRAHSTEMAAALIDFLSDRVALRKMGEAGLQLVERHYSWDAIADRLLDTYGKGIERFARARRLVNAAALDHFSG